MKERIKNLYGSVDKMLSKNNTFISRTYIYQLLNGESNNVSLKVAQELKKLLNLNNIEELIILLEENK